MNFIDFKNLDRKSKIEVAVTFFMVIVFMLILANSVKTIFRSKRAAGKNSYMSTAAFKEVIRRDVISPKDIEAIDSRDIYKDIEKEEELKPWGRDPFSRKAALSGGSTLISDIKIEGILFHHGQKSQAIINGEVLGEGDKIGDITVIKIDKDTVTVTDGKKNYNLHLW